MFTLVPITDAAHIIHGSSGCISKYWGSHSNLVSSSTLHKIRFSTDMEHLGDAQLQASTEKLIAEEIATLEGKLAAYRGLMQGKKVIIHTSGLRSWTLIAAAKTLGMEIIPISYPKMRKEDKTRLKSLLNRDSIVLQKENTEEVIQLINHYQVEMLIASDKLQSAASLTNISFLDINQQSHHSYIGYAGIFTVAKELYATLYSPVWEQARKPAPWDLSNER
ncbi:MAG TPA: hypothetical protein IGS40_27900 [Trichormus sp. M33_DOE_039]|nr:hypothetical protein [Trichormus sp. M33_DOE_039]